MPSLSSTHLLLTACLAVLWLDTSQWAGICARFCPASPSPAPNLAHGLRRLCHKQNPPAHMQQEYQDTAPIRAAPICCPLTPSSALYAPPLPLVLALVLGPLPFYRRGLPVTSGWWRERLDTGHNIQDRHKRGQGFCECAVSSLVRNRRHCTVHKRTTCTHLPRSQLQAATAKPCHPFLPAQSWKKLREALSFSKAGPIRIKWISRFDQGWLTPAQKATLEDMYLPETTVFFKHYLQVMGVRVW